MAPSYGLVLLSLLRIGTTWAQDADITISAHPPSHHVTISPIERTFPPIVSSTPPNFQRNYTIVPWYLRGQPLSTINYNRRNHSRPQPERPWNLHPVISRTSPYPEVNATQYGDQNRHGFWRWIFSGGHWHHEFFVHGNASWHYVPTGGSNQGNVSPRYIRRFPSTSTHTPQTGYNHVHYGQNSIDNESGVDSESGEGSGSSGSGSYSGSEDSHGSSSGESGEPASSEDHSGSDSGSGSSEGSLLSAPGHRASILHRPIRISG